MSTRMGYALLSGVLGLGLLVTAVLLLARPGRPEPAAPAAPAPADGWVGTWSAAPSAAEPGTGDGYPRQSIRNVVHTSIGGSRARVRFSNLYGNRPLTLTHVTLALPASGGAPAAAPGTLRRLTFDGRTEVTVPPGRAVTSDPARLTVPADADVLVTTYAPAPSGPVTHHSTAQQTSYLAHGNRSGDLSGAAYNRRTPYWRYVTGVDVWNPRAQGTLVAVGDSITDGTRSTPGTNHRWPDFLADRLRTEHGAPRYGVLNQGIAGNRLLTDGRRPAPAAHPDNAALLTRLERDVLSRTGARTVVVMIGINDLLRSPRQRDAGAVVAGLREVTDAARDRGLRVVGGTLLPFGGHRGHTPQTESLRQEINRSIRAGRLFDAVIDFDRALSDPAHPERLRPAYDSGDHLHPGDAGYRAMAEAVDLDQLTARAPAATASSSSKG
ncbi:SGNH/GDSL hydrolase family protein [Streptomyces sp. NPDC003077]|uniref:SGNH/GDSL hydrolase family protein n=1 Tax=Streptomyces sp. NPDC003077 TaxID=3154443 RepID=UPI0033B88486